MEAAQRRATYEDFEPLFEWVDDSALHTLQVHIPEFAKEQVKVQVTSTRKLRVNGERPIRENIVSRFRKEFPIQSDVDINKISANFTGGTLYVKLPKLATAITPSERQGSVKPPPTQPETTPKPLQAEALPPQQAQKKQDDVPQKNEEITQPQAVPPMSIVEKQASTNKSNEETQTQPPQQPQTSNAEVGAKESIEKIAEKDAAAGSTCDGICRKSKMDGYKKRISGLAVELKQPKRLMSLVLVASFVAVVALYVQNQFGTITNPDN
ncbi:hypothetical protein ACFE04_018843 [Oxalis oulophora]